MQTKKNLRNEYIKIKIPNLRKKEKVVYGRHAWLAQKIRELSLLVPHFPIT